MTEGASLWLPPHRRAAGRYSMTVELRSMADENAVAALNATTELFVAAANQGAFPAGGVPPSSARLTVAPGRVDVPSQRLMWELEGQGFDLFGFELLRNMFDRLARLDVDVRHIVVGGHGPEGKPRLKPEPTYLTEYEAYPAISPHIRFDVRREGGGDGKFRRCLVELTTTVGASHVGNVRSWVASWFRLLEAAAFALPVGYAWETDCVGGDTTIFDERAIEITVNRLQASECAWHALVNMLETGCGGTPVSKMTIE